MGILGTGISEGLLLKPVRYQWAMDLYDQAVANTWFPNEIQLGEDIADFKKMTDEERHAITFLMSYFNPNELLVNKALAFGVYPYVNAPEAHLYLAKQMWEEANHCMSFEYVLETFPIDRKEAYAAHADIPSMARKEEFEVSFIRRMTEQTLDITTTEGKQDFIRNLVAYNIILEGIWFYSGFMVALSFRQRNLLRNFGSLMDWVVRDESLHLKFGINLILTVLDENPDLQTAEFAAEIKKMITDAVEMEEQYNNDLLPNGILGLNASYINQYVKYLADRRLEELGFDPEYNVTNPAKWMATANDTLQLVNFFESTNTSYESNASAVGQEEGLAAGPDPAGGHLSRNQLLRLAEQALHLVRDQQGRALRVEAREAVHELRVAPDADPERALLHALDDLAAGIRGGRGLGQLLALHRRHHLGRVDARVLGDVRADAAGEDDGDADARALQLGEERLGEELHRRLRGAVGGLARNGEEAAHARHVEQARLGALEQLGQERLRHVDDAPEVDVHDALDDVEVEVLDLHERLDDAGHVEEAVDLAVGLDHGRGESEHGLAVGHVERRGW